MVPIVYSNVNGQSIGYEANDFAKRFFEICDEHRETGRALVFAFILCDETFPQLEKVLQDSAYWAALDKIAGNRISVFYFAAFQPARLEHREKRDYSPEFLTAVTGHRDARVEFESVLVEPAINRDLPAIVFAQVVKGAITDTYVVSLTKNVTPDSLFLEVRSVIETASQALRNVIREGADPHSVFWTLEEALKSRKFRGHAKFVISAIPVIGRFLVGQFEH